jgi:hypothetical protein
VGWNGAPTGAGLDPQDEARIRELPELIANEKDAEKANLLAGLERLLSVEHRPWLSSNRKRAVATSVGPGAHLPVRETRPRPNLRAAQKARWTKRRKAHKRGKDCGEVTG